MTPTDRDRYARIVEWLQPGSLRTVTTCPKCKGSKSLCPACGEIVHDDSVCPVLRPTRHGPCPTCSGSGDVFRTDPEGRQLIERATYEWWNNLDCNKLADYALAARNQFQEDWKRSNTLCFWDNRHGQPWQAAVEQYVREYQPDPPDFSTLEGLAVLKGMLRDAGWTYNIDWDSHSEVFDVTVRPPQSDSSFGEAAALIAAVEAVMPKG